MSQSRKRRIQVYDTTLRDGVQGPGVSFSPAGKLRLCQRLDEFGVDYIEGGYAGSSKGHMAFFAGARKLKLSCAKIVAFGSTRRVKSRVADDDNVQKLVAAGTSVATIVGKASRLHVRDVLRTSAEENLAMISDTVRYLKKRGKQVFFDAEHFYDGYKDDSAFALAAVGAAVDAGCDAVVLCDTNGGSLPSEVFEITRDVVAACPVVVGVHTHNDAGLAVATTLEAVRAGASQVQGTINGYGERSGNADLCSVIPNLQLKMGCSCLKKDSLKDIKSVSVFVADMANVRHDAALPYVGRNAFSHKGGLHVNAVKKNPRTFEHVPPESVGNERTILVSESSGQSTVLLKAIEMGVGGVQKSPEDMRKVLAALKDLESRGYAFEAADASFQILVQKVLKEHKAFFELEGFRVIVEKRGHDEPCISEATIKMKVGGKVEHTAGEGHGPVDALDHALRKALRRFYPEIAKVFLTDFRVRILDPEEATAATTRVLIESGDGTSSWGTVGVSENIIEASWEALVDSMEYKLFRVEEEQRKRSGRKKKK